MALSHNPKIATDGLTFCYDMGNPKSWQGKPVTNYVANAGTMSSFGNYSSGTPTSFITEFGTTGWRMNNLGAWNGVAQGGISLPSTGQYTFSAWARYLGGHSNQTGGAVYTSGFGIGDTATYIDKSKIGQWQRITNTQTVTGTSGTLYLISWGGTYGSDNSSWEVTMPQIEPGSYASPWVDGSRSSTQAILDLTGNNTLTATSLTYNSDNTFSFNKSTNCIDINNTALISGTSPFTIEAAFYVNSASGGQAILGNYGSGYTSNAVWFATHGFWLNGASPYFSGGQLAAGTYIIAVTRDSSGNILLYRNGVQVGSGTNAASIASNINWRIGADVNGAAEPFGGTIFSVRTYSRALSATEILQNFHAQRARYQL